MSIPLMTGCYTALRAEAARLLADERIMCCGLPPRTRPRRFFLSSIASEAQIPTRPLLRAVQSATPERGDQRRLGSRSRKTLAV
jgi:hypothetical protein